MESVEKRKLKKMYKTFTWLGYICAASFFVFFITLLIVRKNSDADWDKPIIILPVVLGLLSPLFAGLIFNTFASFKRAELVHYKKRILMYRARKYANKAIEQLLQGNVQAAVDEYIKCKRYPEHELDDYVYGMLISAAMLTGDEKLKKIGTDKINDVKEEFDPSKIVL